jgi:ubiquinol-cytochrome c reductase cytochrome b subunit
MRVPDPRPSAVARRLSRWGDDRLGAAGLARSVFNKVFPDHWSFLLGEIALYSFVVLILTGTFLAMFFTPSSHEIVYHGSYVPLRGITVSEAYRSTLDLSFDVRGGLLMRQLHHWAANLFVAAIVVHMLRIFFTGAYRRPREMNWFIGLLLFWLAFVEGFAGYSLPDDGLSGTGLRIADSIVLSIPLIGTWASFALFGGEFPGTLIIERLYIAHVFLIPGIIAALIALHLVLVVVLKHTQWPGPGRTEHNVVGHRMIPGFAGRSTGLFLCVFAVLALMAGLVQINPVWLWGPYQASAVSSASQPDWYVMFLEGSMRAMPAWEIRVHVAGHGYTVPPVFWAAVVLPGVLTVLAMAWPLVENRMHRDQQLHNLLQRPRDNPQRTALGVMAVAFFVVLTLNGVNDVIADKFDISLNAMVWAGRIGLLVIPPAAWFIAYRLCLSAQQHDRQTLFEGVETGLVVQSPSGEMSEVHQPVVSGEADEDTYQGGRVPVTPGDLGIVEPAPKGFFVSVEPAPRTKQLERDAQGAPADAEQEASR